MTTNEGFDCSRCGAYANPAVYRPGEPIRDRMMRGRLCSGCAYADIDAEISEFEAKVKAATEAITQVLLDPKCTTYPPHRSRLHDALDVLELEITCGDCVEGRCHWGGERSRESIAAAEQGRDVGGCGCVRHAASVEARDRARRLRAAAVVSAEGGAS